MSQAPRKMLEEASGGVWTRERSIDMPASSDDQRCWDQLLEMMRAGGDIITRRAMVKKMAG